MDKLWGKIWVWKNCLAKHVGEVYGKIPCLDKDAEKKTFSYKESVPSYFKRIFSPVTFGVGCGFRACVFSNYFGIGYNVSGIGRDSHV